MVKRICPICKREFEVTQNQINYGRGIYCSTKCQHEARQNSKYFVIKENYAEMVIKYKNENLIILIDKEDIDKLKPYCWTATLDKKINKYYILARLKEYGEDIRLHRFIMNCPKGMFVDHINHNTLDNRKANLRICNQWGNNQNTNRNTSGYIGVRWEEDRQKWIARITYKGYVRTIGRYKDLQEAIKARKQAEKEYGLIQTFELPQKTTF